jgi:hypothetical protein
LADGVGGDRVDDDEILYRSVVPKLWKQKNSGEFYLSRKRSPIGTADHPLTVQSFAATTRATRNSSRPTTSAASLPKKYVP